MFKIKGLYKEKKNNILKGIDINIDKGNSVSIECSNEISDLLALLDIANTKISKLSYSQKRRSGRSQEHSSNLNLDNNFWSYICMYL
ncbi:hypothetical protein [Clostridium estertheticum]|uniref:hypothetical protein n=1 Tax=Clostridium estertheticum TaxID=238834 RepID=UPI001FAAABEA|nr:hypothetical protein [Clostridium estertheticum]